MKRTILCTLLLALVAVTAGCLCSPCGGGFQSGYPMMGGACGPCETACGPCDNVCGPSCDSGCDPCETVCGPWETCGPIGTGGTFYQSGCGLKIHGNPCGPCFPVLTQCAQGTMMLIHGVGQMAVSIVTVPIGLVGGIFDWGTCGVYRGCGCSSERYYGDNCEAVSACSPCLAAGCGGGYNPGCQKCANGYIEGINQNSDGMPIDNGNGYHYPADPVPVPVPVHAPMMTAPIPDQSRQAVPQQNVRQVAFQQPNIQRSQGYTPTHTHTH